MSNEEKKPELPKSFEDAMKKIVNTKMDNSIMIEEIGKEYPISNVAGKNLSITELTVDKGRVDNFIVKIIIRKKDEELSVQYTPTINPNQKTTTTAYFDQEVFVKTSDGKNSIPYGVKPLKIPPGAKVSITIINFPSLPKEHFDVASLSYKISE